MYLDSRKKNFCFIRNCVRMNATEHNSAVVVCFVKKNIKLPSTKLGNEAINWPIDWSWIAQYFFPILNLAFHIFTTFSFSITCRKNEVCNDYGARGVHVHIDCQFYPTLKTKASELYTQLKQSNRWNKNCTFLVTCHFVFIHNSKNAITCFISYFLEKNLYQIFACWFHLHTQTHSYIYIYIYVQFINPI